jgi:hypothetical protein
MQVEEILQWLSDNHRKCILLGGLLSFISLFLPFWDVLIVGVGSWIHGYTAESVFISISQTWIFWIFLLLIIGLYYGYYREYSVTHPHLYLVIGVVLLLLTFYAYLFVQREDFVDVRCSYGFFLELLGSLSIAVGGYYYYQKKVHQF